MFLPETEVLTSKGWLKTSSLYSLLEEEGGIDIATIVNNTLLYTKISEAVKETNSTQVVSLISNEKNESPDLYLSGKHKVCYSRTNDGEIKISSVAELCDKGPFFIPKCIYVPDGMEVSPETQEHISTMGLMAILYLYTFEFYEGYVTLNNFVDNYSDDLATHAGFLKLKTREFENNHNQKVVLDLTPTISGLSPLSKIFHNSAIGNVSKTCRVFPQWFFNAHPYAQKEFIKILLSHLTKHKKNMNYWEDLLPSSHIDKIISLGIQCGIPIIGKTWESISIAENNYIFAQESKLNSYHNEFYGFLIKPTNTICVRHNGKVFITSGGIYE